MNFRSSLLLLLLVATSGFSAEEPGDFHVRDMVGIGMAYQTVDADLRATVGALPEVKVDLDDLGIKHDDLSWALEGRWRFKPRWMLVGLAYQFDQNGRRAVKEDFNFDGKEFQAGASVDTELSIDTYILDVMYSAYSNANAEVLVGGGIHAIDLETSIRGRAFVGNIEREATTGSSELLAPLPNLRLQAYYRLNHKWGMGLYAGWLSANYGDYDGGFTYIHPRIAYGMGDHWSLTLGYQYVKLDLTQEKSSRRENEYNIDFKGPTLFLDYRF
ncbi:hypothetical protein E2F43_05760 [Seongchinamella unica]|uniref:Uncharacterized protein n=1 Tax=Seongchinamella unica TaxID=2547392 RepID=A0A4R5LWB8_9GAMM|nr:outer membrane beta-barrel protein [Seongchinamella unica]TDG15730.1 hypothetical protein E2F43_05760 [Seongchinamella unica]